MFVCVSQREVDICEDGGLSGEEKNVGGDRLELAAVECMKERETERERARAQCICICM